MNALRRFSQWLSREKSDSTPHPQTVLNLEALTATVSVLPLQAGDIVVLRFPCALSEKLFAQLKEHAKPLFPNNRIVVLEGGADLTILRTGDKE